MQEQCDYCYVATPVACPPGSPVLRSWHQHLLAVADLTVHRKRQYGEGMAGLRAAISTWGLEPSIREPCVCSPATSKVNAAYPCSCLDVAACPCVSAIARTSLSSSEWWGSPSGRLSTCRCRGFSLWRRFAMDRRTRAWCRRSKMMSHMRSRSTVIGRPLEGAALGLGCSSHCILAQLTLL